MTNIIGTVPNEHLMSYNPGKWNWSNIIRKGSKRKLNTGINSNNSCVHYSNRVKITDIKQLESAGLRWALNIRARVPSLETHTPLALGEVAPVES